MVSKWIKNYLILEEVPPFWLSVLILLIFDFHLKGNLPGLAFFALLAAAITKYNILFLIPFCPTEE
jgi:hypothetical protein